MHRFTDLLAHCSQPSPSRIFCTDALPNSHLTSQETTIYSGSFNGYQIWFHSSGNGETLCGSISSRSGSTSNFWTQGDGSTIGKVEVDGSDIKMYVGGTLIRGPARVRRAAEEAPGRVRRLGGGARGGWQGGAAPGQGVALTRLGGTSPLRGARAPRGRVGAEAPWRAPASSQSASAREPWAMEKERERGQGCRV